MLTSLFHRSKKRTTASGVTEEACSEQEMLRAIDGYMFLDYNTTQRHRSTDDTKILNGVKRRDWWKAYNATDHATVYGQVRMGWGMG